MQALAPKETLSKIQILPGISSWTGSTVHTCLSGVSTHNVERLDHTRESDSVGSMYQGLPRSPVCPGDQLLLIDEQKTKVRGANTFDWHAPKVFSFLPQAALQGCCWNSSGSWLPIDE